MERRLAAILAADMVGYSRLMNADELGTLQRLKTLRRDRIEPVIAEHHGRLVKLMGDGALIEFASVIDAVACGVHIQSVVSEHNASVAKDHQICFRIGINLGDVLVEDGDIYGDGVNVAARIEAMAEPGSVMVSQTVRDHVGNKLRLEFDDLGEQHLKNIDRAIRVFRVRAKNPVADSIKEPQTMISTRPSVAVLPFANMSGDPDQEYFSDGIAEDIIIDLAKVSGLFVIARNITFVHKGKSVDIQELSRKLGVRCVLEGSVRKAGNRVRIAAQLIEGHTGGHLWAERFDRELTDIFAVQDEITRQIVKALRVQLLPVERTAIASPPTRNIEAYEYLLRGRQLLSMLTKSSLQLARRMFAKAAEIDPQFARAYAGVAICTASLVWQFGMSISLEDIFIASARALSLDPHLADAHAAHGLALAASGRFDEVEAAFHEALRLDPNLWETHFFFARAKIMLAEPDAAIDLWRRAAELWPDDYSSLMLIGMTCRRLRRDGEAREAYRVGLERAQSAIERQPDNATAAFTAAVCSAALGYTKQARTWAARALAIEPDDLMTQYNVACVLSLLGDVDEAIALLERIMPRASDDRRAWMAQDSDFDPLREHPRFKALLPQPHS